MSTAKDNFLERIYALEKSIMIESVTSKALTEKEHNQIARLLRNGLAVVGFAALEDFIKNRCSEILEAIGPVGITFSQLPDKVRYAVTYEALSALSYQMNLRDKEAKVAYVQDHALKISSTSNSAFSLTPHAFGFSQANVSDSTIKDILSCFGVKDPWGQMSTLSSRLGLTTLSLQESYKNASLRRHKAAHVAHADTPQNDILQFVKEAIAVAITFDCLLSKAFSYISRLDSDYIAGRKVPTDSSVKFRFIRHEGGYWKEFADGRSKAIKRETDIATLRTSAQRRSSTANETLVVYTLNGIPCDWLCN